MENGILDELVEAVGIVEDRRKTVDKRSCDQEIKECHLASASAEEAVRKVFAILGVDIDVPRDVEQFRQDLRFGSSLRSASEKWRLIFWGAVITSAVGVVIAWVPQIIEQLSHKGN